MDLFSGYYMFLVPLNLLYRLTENITWHSD
jgi:hypothetical protein